MRTSNQSGALPVTYYSQTLCARGLTVDKSEQQAIAIEALQRVAGGVRGAKTYATAFKTPLAVPLSFPLVFRPSLDYRCVY